jgi:Arc/MetJ family transcription regulator
VRTNIESDDRLLRDGIRGSGGKTRNAVVDAALRLLAQTKKQAAIRRLRDQVAWDGDLEPSRTNRVSSAR